MTGTRRTAALLLAWLVPACGAGAADDAAELIRQVAPATKTLNYEGTLIYAHDSQIDAMRIVHKAEDGAEYERLLSLTGKAREVIRDGARITCTFADDRAVVVEKRRPQDFIRPSGSIATYSDQHDAFQTLADDRIAERATKVVLIRPKAPDRYSYQLWIDKATNLLLKSSVLNTAGTVLEQVMFIAVSIGQPIDDASLQSELDGAGFTWHADEEAPNAATAEEAMQLDIGWVPAGFSLKNTHTQHFASKRMPVRHAVYSDGLAMVSVFIEALTADAPPLQGYSSMGAVNAFSRMDHQYQITVVGEVPQTTVRRIAASVAIQ